MDNAGKVAVGAGIIATLTGLGFLIYRVTRPHGGLTVKQVSISGVQPVTTGEVLVLTATATYSDGSTKDVSLDSTWVSDDPTIAAVETPSVIQGISAGSVIIEVNYLGVVGAAVITVS
jgi:hypothetical protein